jgi:AraC family transcriptional regulator, exoenzyme S synthesis regulatory protein ExsA
MNNTYDYSVSHPDYFKQLAVKDLLFLHYICPQIEKYVYLYTHFNQISFTLGGNKIFHHGSRSWKMTDNTSIFARKAAYKQEIGTAGWEILAFYFPDSYLQRFFNENRQHLPLKNLPDPPRDMFIEININEITRAFFYSIVPYFSQEIPPPENLLELKFKELLFNILTNPANASLLAYISSMSDQHKPPLPEIMEANFSFHLSLTDFARIAQRSLATFKRDFIEMYHVSPGKWLSQKRLDHAKLLLDTSKKNVNEIAYDSGFESVTHFSRVFKEKFGSSPLQYRKQYQSLDLVPV